MVAIAALAAIVIALVSLQPEPDSSGTRAAAPGAAAPGQDKPATEAPEPEPGEPKAAETSEVLASSPEESDDRVPVRIVVLPAKVHSEDPITQSLIETARRVILTELRASPDIDQVIDLSAADLAAIVPSSAGPLGENRVVYLAITRRYPDAQIVEVSDQPARAGMGSIITMRHIRARGSSGATFPIGEQSNSGFSNIATDPDTVGRQLAARLIQQTSSSAGILNLADGSSFTADPSLSAEAQLTALRDLRTGTLTGEAISTAAALATTADSELTRRNAWILLRTQTFDPVLAEPLSYSLLSDPDPYVRLEAARSLTYYIDENAARSALEHAANNDASPEVRLTAQMATMSADERQAFQREILLDQSLAPEERIAPMSFDDPRMRTVHGAGDASALDAETVAYAQIALASSDTSLQQTALSRMFSNYVGRRNWRDAPAVPPEIADALISGARSEHEGVRRISLSMLTNLGQHPDMRAILETLIEEDPSVAEDSRVRAILQQNP